MTTADLSGIWKLSHSENFDEFLVKMDVGIVKRTMASKASPEITIEQKGDHFKIVTKAGFTTRTQEFDIGEEFEATGLDKKALATASWDGNKLVVNVKPPAGGKGFPQIVTREITEPNVMCMTMDADPESDSRVICKRFFEKIIRNCEHSLKTHQCD